MWVRFHMGLVLNLKIIKSQYFSQPLDRFLYCYPRQISLKNVSSLLKMFLKQDKILAWVLYRLHCSRQSLGSIFLPVFYYNRPHLEYQ